MAKTLGQIAFEACALHAGLRTRQQGTKQLIVKTWTDLSLADREVWEAVGSAVIDHIYALEDAGNYDEILRLTGLR